MSTLIVVLIVLFSIAITFYLLIFLHKREHKKRSEEMLRRFSQLGSKYNLSFTAQEVMGNRVIGLDGIKRKLLFFELDDTNPIWSIIDLSEVKSCCVKKIYANLNSVSSLHRSTEAYLQAITLEFNLNESDCTVALPIYQHVINAMQEATGLEAKAKNWESMLSKMIPKERNCA